MTKVRNVLVGAALFAALAIPIYFLVAALGTKYGLLDWRVGFGLMVGKIGPLVLFGAAGLALVALGAALIVPPRRGRRLALLALAVPVGAMAYAAHVRTVAMANPIHDVSTALDRPPEFSPAVQQARGAMGANSLDLYSKRVPEGFGAHGGALARDVQRALYRDIQPIVVAIPAGQAFDLAERTARGQGWTIGAVDREAGRIEGTVRSFWFGFTDDVVVRVSARPVDQMAVVDVRSVSRVGQSDLGANAARVRRFLAAYEKALAGVS